MMITVLDVGGQSAFFKSERCHFFLHQVARQSTVKFLVTASYHALSETLLMCAETRAARKQCIQSRARFVVVDDSSLEPK